MPAGRSVYRVFKGYGVAMAGAEQAPAGMGNLSLPKRGSLNFENETLWVESRLKEIRSCMFEGSLRTYATQDVALIIRHRAAGNERRAWDV